MEKIAEERLAICRSNICKRHDPDGQSEKAVFKGAESCAACGCRLDLKVRSLSSNCGLEVEGLIPLWFALTSEQDNEMIQSQIAQDNEI